MKTARLYQITRRLFLLGWLIAVPSVISTDIISAQKSSRPNIIFIIADDLGWSDLGSYGADLHETPHLDELAKQNIRFTHAYSSAPVCSPTRAAFMTGLHPARLGITIWSEGASKPDTSHKLLPCDSLDHLPLKYQTIS